MPGAAWFAKKGTEDQIRAETETVCVSCHGLDAPTLPGSHALGGTAAMMRAQSATTAARAMSECLATAESVPVIIGGERRTSSVYANFCFADGFRAGVANENHRGGQGGGGWHVRGSLSSGAGRCGQCRAPATTTPAAASGAGSRADPQGGSAGKSRGAREARTW